MRKKKEKLLLEEERMNLSDQFKPSSTFADDLGEPKKKESGEAQLFQLSEFLEGVSERDRSFIFESSALILLVDARCLFFKALTCRPAQLRVCRAKQQCAARTSPRVGRALFMFYNSIRKS